jgi:hypothetical protein
MREKSTRRGYGGGRELKGLSPIFAIFLRTNFAFPQKNVRISLRY